MTRIIDKNGRIAEIEMNYYNEPNWSPDCSQDWIVPESTGYDEEAEAYKVDCSVDDWATFCDDWSKYQADTDLAADDEDLEAERKYLGERSATCMIISNYTVYRTGGENDGEILGRFLTLQKAMDFARKMTFSEEYIDTDQGAGIIGPEGEIEW